MSDFETLYDEKLSSLQENEIVDEDFVSVLHSQDFVALLKCLYESSDETETSSIYLHCVEQGFRVCDLQRALCYLNDEWYDGPICFISDIDNTENVLTPDENIEQPQKPQPTYEKFYLHIQYISEEEVLVGVKNVSFEVNNDLIDVMYYKLGENVVIVETSGNKLAFRVEVQVSPTFLAWCCSFGDKLEVASPKNVREQLSTYINSMGALYE